MIACFLAVLGGYLALGLAFGAVFALVGAKAIDPGAAKGSWGFKLIVIPGCAVFWPLLLQRWVRRMSPPEESSAHRRAAKD